MIVLYVHFLNDKLWVDFRMRAHNAEISTGCISKKEAQAFLQQFVDCLKEVNEMKEDTE